MRRFVLYLGVCLLLIMLAVRFATTKSDSFFTAPDIGWTAPADKHLNNVGPADPAHSGRSFECTPLGYRLIDDLTKTMHQGCFVPAAFGMIDPNQSVAIFNGSDEAQYIKQGGQPAALSIMPESGAVARFGTYPGTGNYMYLYRNFYSALADAGSPLVGRYKLIDQAPDFAIRDSAGSPLVMNPQALGYASRSQWLVTEVPGHSLVRINLATFSIMPFADAFDPPQRANYLHRAAVTISEDGRYAVVGSSEYKKLTVYDLKNCGLVVTSDPLVAQNCRSYDYWPYIEQQVSGAVQNISHLQFVQDGVLSLDVQTAQGSEQYLLSPDGPITSLLPYLGLGDSYASGQGAFNYLGGTDTERNKCHSSAHAYPQLLNRDLFGSRGHSVACSGARSHDIGNTTGSYTGQSSDQVSASLQQSSGNEVSIMSDFKPGYLAQQRFVTAYQPATITLQIGGNDIGFSSLLLRCISPIRLTRPPALQPNSCYQNYEDRLELKQLIDRQSARWTQLYKQLQRQAPLSRLYVVGYPQIFSTKADCRLNAPVTLAEIEFSRELIDYLNGVIQQAASAAKAQYVDVGDALASHELCSGASGTLAVNGLTAGDDAYGLGQESFHPKAYGHELLEQAILRKTRNMTLGSMLTPTTVSDNGLLQAPKSGRPIKNISFNDTGSAKRLERGGTAPIALDGSTFGLKPGSDYAVTIGGQPSGNPSSDFNGTIKATLPVPTNIQPGLQPIIVTGPGQGGTPIEVVQIVYIVVDPFDDDGDGIPDTRDSCPTIVNSGQDTNQNGIDDVCDTVPPDVTPATPTTPAMPLAPETLVPVAILPSPTETAAPPSIPATVDLLQPVANSGVLPIHVQVVSHRTATVASKYLHPVVVNRPRLISQTATTRQASLGQPRSARLALPILAWRWWLLGGLLLYAAWLSLAHRRASK